MPLKNEDTFIGFRRYLHWLPKVSSSANEGIFVFEVGSVNRFDGILLVFHRRFFAIILNSVETSCRIRGHTVFRLISMEGYFISAFFSTVHFSLSESPQGLPSNILAASMSPFSCQSSHARAGIVNSPP